MNEYARFKDFKTIYKTQGAYHYHSNGFKLWFLKDNYQAIADECNKSDSVMDLACGEGCLGSYLDVSHLEGVDYSEEALNLNRQLYPGVYDKLHLGDLRYLDKLSIPLESFTVAACSLSLMYLTPEDLDKCLHDIYGLLKSKGIFVCTYPTVGPNRKGSTEALEIEPHVLTQHMSKAGFSLEELKPFCPLVPKEVVDAGELEETRDEAFAEYQRAKETMTLETSYHFICKVRKP